MRSASAMRGIVLDAEVILVAPPRMKPTLRGSRGAGRQRFNSQEAGNLSILSLIDQ
jgi:hypothetical protein